MTIEHIFVYAAMYTSIVLLLTTTLFLVMQWKRDNSLIDIAYGPTFCIAALATIGLLHIYTPTTLLIVALMGLWASRLSFRIAKKNWGKPEDVRYAAWRTAWMKRGHVYFMLRSYLQINLLQGILIVLIATPFIISLTANSDFHIFLLLGTIISLSGIIIETIADSQIDTFIRNKQTGKETSPFLSKGLFRYSRRPNYFGETLVWWGYALMVLPLPYGYLALIGPITITYIVTRITGPMIEKIFIEKYGASYETYMKQTSYFLPLPPRR